MQDVSTPLAGRRRLMDAEIKHTAKVFVDLAYYGLVLRTLQKLGRCSPKLTPPLTIPSEAVYCSPCVVPGRHWRAI